MRLTADQQQFILQIVRQIAGESGEVWIYGSRRDDSRRGGDIDLLVRSPTELSLLERARIKNAIESSLQLPVDVQAAPLHGQLRPFAQIALATGLRL